MDKGRKSFSATVKEELNHRYGAARHCQLAELWAILHCGAVLQRTTDGGYWLNFQTENDVVARKCFTLWKKTYNIGTDVLGQDESKQHTQDEGSLPSDNWTKYLTKEEGERIFTGFDGFEEPINPKLLKNACCQRAFLRGTFLCSGSMSDPQKSYHMEFVCTTEAKAKRLQAVIRGFQADAKIVIRKKYHVVYLKEASGIVDLLNIMEAHIALMEFENLRIVKDVRNFVNRRVNCEAANITKTVSASTRQVEDIELIQTKIGFSNLPEHLRETAMKRLQYPDHSLKELGESMMSPVGKSGINHRLRTLAKMADEIRKNEEGVL
ncbi:MAG: DNA-binding protein WhiA [Lachnospiraceae bacterium]|jgi:DNA-binding protein WhiA|nr:DNA-binding protein WhiA [Lachnospiraceae bacterium]